MYSSEIEMPVPTTRETEKENETGKETHSNEFVVICKLCFSNYVKHLSMCAVMVAGFDLSVHLLCEPMRCVLFSFLTFVGGL